MAVFFATRFSFAPVLRTTPFADLLVFFDEVPDFLRLAFFMDSSRSIISFSLAHSIFSGKDRTRAFLRGQLIDRPRDRGRPLRFAGTSTGGAKWPKRQTPPSGREAALAGFAELVCEIRSGR